MGGFPAASLHPRCHSTPGGAACATLAGCEGCRQGTLVPVGQHRAGLLCNLVAISIRFREEVSPPLTRSAAISDPSLLSPFSWWTDGPGGASLGSHHVLEMQCSSHCHHAAPPRGRPGPGGCAHRRLLWTERPHLGSIRRERAELTGPMWAGRCSPPGSMAEPPALPHPLPSNLRRVAVGPRVEVEL